MSKNTTFEEIVNALNSSAFHADKYSENSNQIVKMFWLGKDAEWGRRVFHQARTQILQIEEICKALANRICYRVQ